MTQNPSMLTAGLVGFSLFCSCLTATAPPSQGGNAPANGDGVQVRAGLGLPFGINNAFAGSKANTDLYLKDLGVEWISDHLARRGIEKMKKNAVSYDFSEVDAKLAEYARQAQCRAWFIINIESKYPFEDGKRIGKGKKSEGKYIPNGPASYRAYGDFLRALVRHVNGAVPGWKAEIWSIDNEQASLYVPAFCPDGLTPESGRRAADAYAETLLFSARIIHEVDPPARIVFGGPGGGTPDEEYDWFYQPALKSLAARVPGGGFDFFDYHNFNTYRGYTTNPRGKGLDYFRRLLADASLPGKPIIIKAGATHSGQDQLAVNKRLHEPQTEAEQAEYLVKRFVWHVAAGVPLILWGDAREDEKRHSTYSHNGLLYNGIPRAGDCDGAMETPCPDPGDGVPKLSYYALKHLIEKLKASDWSKTETIATGEKGTFVCKFVNAQDRPVWVAWRDDWNGADGGQRITIDVGNATALVVTDGLPNAVDGAGIIASRYQASFAQRQLTAAGGKAVILLGKSPVFIETGE